jgi:hypothetical protein
MSKFTIKVELQGLKIEVEGSREDVPRLAQRVGEQVGSLVQPALLLEAESRAADSDGDHRTASDQGRIRRRRVGSRVPHSCGLCNSGVLDVSFSCSHTGYPILAGWVMQGWGS